MSKNSLKILDSIFSHAYSSSGMNIPKNFTWDREFDGYFEDIVKQSCLDCAITAMTAQCGA